MEEEGGVARRMLRAGGEDRWYRTNGFVVREREAGLKWRVGENRVKAKGVEASQNPTKTGRSRNCMMGGVGSVWL